MSTNGTRLTGGALGERLGRRLVIPGRKPVPASPVAVQIHAPKIESRR